MIAFFLQKFHALKETLMFYIFTVTFNHLEWTYLICVVWVKMLSIFNIFHKISHILITIILIQLVYTFCNFSTGWYKQAHFIYEYEGGSKSPCIHLFLFTWVHLHKGGSVYIKYETFSFMPCNMDSVALLVELRHYYKDIAFWTLPVKYRSEVHKLSNLD